MTAVAIKAAPAATYWSSNSATASDDTVVSKVFAYRARYEDELKAIANLSFSDAPPSERALHQAVAFLPEIFDRATRLGSWSSPHITSTYDGEIAFEWWAGKRKLSFYFGDDGSEFIKVWGPNVDSEMESGELRDGWNMSALWLWLHA